MNAPTFAFVALAAAALVWLGAGAATAAVLRPRRPREGPMTSTLHDEPPAVVNLLTHNWRVTASAAAATVVDLANRKLIDIVQYSPENDVIELRPIDRRDPNLETYELQLLDHLRHKAVQGVVPASALTTGPAAVSDAWWRRFRRAVERDARRRGLSRRQLPPAAIIVFAIVVVALVGWLLVALSATSDAPTNDGPRLWSVVTAIALVGVCLMVARRFDRHRQRDTDAGLDAARYWLGVRRGYTEGGRYNELTPAAVVLYERHLAYAAAMDAARRTVARLPLSAEDDRDAWSRHGSHWRQVEVRYPHRRIGWGQGPGRALIGGLLWTATLLIPIVYLVQVGTDLRPRLEDAARSVGQVTDPSNRLYDEVAADRIALGITWAIALVLAFITINAVYRGLLRVSRGLLDAGRETPLRGTVVRRRTWPRQRGTESVEVHWIAVDDGSTNRIRAFIARPFVAAAIHQDDEVELDVTPYLGFVRRATVTAPAPPLPPPVPVEELVGPTPLPPVHWIEEMMATNGHNGDGTNGHHASGTPARQWRRFRPTRSAPS
jgi:Predicted membrane protein (DUF2207)